MLASLRCSLFQLLGFEDLTSQPYDQHASQIGMPAKVFQCAGMNLVI
jgi:hypothetical protein